MKLNIQDKFNKELPADLDSSNTRRQVDNACFSYVRPRIPQSPQLIHHSEEVASIIGLTNADVESADFLDIFSGKKVLEGTSPYSMCYGGHQFGNWAGQLGDGRAINLAEVEHDNHHWSLQLKGAGATPYSRRADGLAVLRSSIREHLCSEAMFHLGVPTTRSLSLILTGDEVLRDMMYNGNAAYEKGAVVCRVAPTFIRFGNFQIFASRGDIKNLKLFTDFTIRHYYPDIKGDSKQNYITFFEKVAQQTLDMIIHWQRVGFVHGVMNTDNMSILGLTIDYGPYGWLEGYDPNWTPNTTDSRMHRYSFGKQHGIALWNLAQLGNALYSLINEVEPMQAVIDDFHKQYQIRYFEMMRKKLGLQQAGNLHKELIINLVENLQLIEMDMTIFFRTLADFSFENEENYPSILQDAIYNLEEFDGEVVVKWRNWFSDYSSALEKENLPPQVKKQQMNAVNPKYVLRNYMAQLAIDAADKGDYDLIDELHQMLKKPYDEQPAYQKWFAKRPEWARHKVGCSMLSCSS